MLTGASDGLETLDKFRLGDIDDFEARLRREGFVSARGCERVRIAIAKLGARS